MAAAELAGERPDDLLAVLIVESLVATQLDLGCQDIEQWLTEQVARVGDLSRPERRMDPYRPLDLVLGGRSEWVLAASHQAPARVLAWLATSPRQKTRSAVADNSTTPQEVIRQLFRDPDPQVRKMAIGNLNAPIGDLRRLVRETKDVEALQVLLVTANGLPQSDIQIILDKLDGPDVSL